MKLPVMLLQGWIQLSPQNIQLAFNSTLQQEEDSKQIAQVTFRPFEFSLWPVLPNFPSANSDLLLP